MKAGPGRGGFRGGHAHPRLQGGAANRVSGGDRRRRAHLSRLVTPVRPPSRARAVPISSPDGKALSSSVETVTASRVTIGCRMAEAIHPEDQTHGAEIGRGRMLLLLMYYVTLCGHG